MFRRILTLLLIPMLLGSQGLAWEHSHLGTGVAEPQGHDRLAHFHAGCHGTEHDHHAGHSHDGGFGRGTATNAADRRCEPLVCPATNHDADAIYCPPTVTLALNASAEPVSSTGVVVASAIPSATHQYDGASLRHGLLCGLPSAVFDATGPIYLRTHSLRI